MRPYIEAVAQLLAVVCNNAEGGNGIGLCGCQRGGTVQDVVKTIHPQAVQSLSGQRVLHDRVVDRILAHLAAERGILFNGNTLIVYQNTGTCILDAVGQRLDDRLLFAENLCVWHV